MSAMYNLRLPASELAKLEPLRRHDHADPGDAVVRTPVAPAPAAANTGARRRLNPAHRLSGFARA